MAKSKKYWAVAYAHVVRWAGPCETEEQAVMETFGVSLKHQGPTNGATVKQFPSNPKYMAQYKRLVFLEALVAEHEKRTGIKVT